MKNYIGLLLALLLPIWIVPFLLFYSVVEIARSLNLIDEDFMQL